MSYYNETFQIVNNTDQTLTFDSAGSSGTHDWPATVAPHSSSETFTQTGNFQINLTAAYVVGNSGTNVYFHFYCIGLDPEVHVNMTLQYSNNSLFVNNEISETNSNTNQTRSGAGPLSITTDGVGSSGGNATYTIG